MNSASLIRVALLLLPLSLGSGCATHALWTKVNLDAWNEPADDPNLRLFDAPHRQDLLVVYDEYAERTDSVRTRAYWLKRNQERIEQRREPAFVSAREAHRLNPVPVFASTNASRFDTVPEATCAVISADHKFFTLYSNGQTGAPCAFPVYDDGSGRAKRIALTPLTVVADITIVGGVIGYLCLEGMAQSGTSFQFPR